MAKVMLTPLYISDFGAASRGNSLKAKRGGGGILLALQRFMGRWRQRQTATFGLNCVLVLPALNLARFIPKVFCSF